MKVYDLRAHHGMCFAFYKGIGYSSDFTENMDKIKHELENNRMLCLKKECDVICACCPENIDGKCRSFSKVKAYDEKVLSACGLEAGEKISSTDFFDLIKNKILIPGLREKICGSCQWNQLCKETQEKNYR